MDHHFSGLAAPLTSWSTTPARRGELRSTASTEVVAGMVLAVPHGFAHLAYQDRSAEHHDQVVRAFEQLIDGQLLEPGR